LYYSKLFFICAIFFNSVIYSESYIENLEIDATSIVISPKDNQIIFSNNVILDTGKLVLKSDSAIYNELDKTMTLEGLPSSISSLDSSKTFNGNASKIIFFNNSKVQLIGSAVMNYDNINISSNSIIFNPENGKMSSSK
jgi:lipopolysaccharide transport protein LptA